MLMNVFWIYSTATKPLHCRDQSITLLMGPTTAELILLTPMTLCAKTPSYILHTFQCLLFMLISMLNNKTQTPYIQLNGQSERRNMSYCPSAEKCLNSSAAEENCWLMVGVHPSPHLITSKIQLMRFQQLLQARLEEHSNTKGNGLYFCRKVCKSLFCTSWKFNKDSGNYTNVYCNMF